MTPDFDERCKKITQDILAVADWKQIFFGAAYSTRLKSASQSLRLIADSIDRLIEDDE